MNPCELLGHTWVVRPVKGRLVEVCSTCNVTPED